MNQQNNTTGFSKYPVSKTDPRFPSFLQGFNQRWQADHCEVVYVCYSAEGVAAALEEATSLEWMNAFYTSVYIETGGTPNPQLDLTDNVDGCYYNYPDSDLNEFGGLEGALQLYFGGNLTRLKEVKRRWDPTNYFNSFQSIPVE